jgi:hypothetical protein
MRSTITEALISMRGLHHADAGRLHGVNLRYHDLPLAQLTQLAQHSDRAVTGLAALITARSDGTITPDTPEYLVLSSGVPVAWLTVHAAVTTPDLPLTPAQARHQSQAAEALGGLYRHTLADTRRPPRTASRRRTGGRRALPCPADRTRGRPDPHRLDPDRQRSGRCREGRSRRRPPRHRPHPHPRRLRLRPLWQPRPSPRAGHPMRDAHDRRRAPGAAVLHRRLDRRRPVHRPAPAAGSLAERFRHAYAGHFTSREAYTQHRMDTLGWTAVLREHGMGDYFSRNRYTYDLFTQEVTGVGGPGRSDRRGGVHVFRRPE